MLASQGRRRPHGMRRILIAISVALGDVNSLKRVNRLVLAGVLPNFMTNLQGTWVAGNLMAIRAVGDGIMELTTRERCFMIMRSRNIGRREALPISQNPNALLSYPNPALGSR